MSSSLSSKTILGAALCLFVVQLDSFCVANLEFLHKERANDGAPSPLWKEGDGQHSDFEHASILGSQKEVEEFEDLDPEEAKKRLRGIAKRMDANHDGFVDQVELKNWILKSFASLVMEEVTERFEDADRNGDRFVSFDEHVIDTFGEDGVKIHSDKEEKEKHRTLLEEERELFELADTDKNKLLTLEEYARVLQPQEFPEMQKLIVTHALKRRDTDNDGKISMEEFLKDEKLSKENLLDERERFQYDLDKNKDFVLDFDEFFHWVIPDNNQIADTEVEHLMDKADDNHDGKLSIDEVVDHQDVFVSSEATDYGEHLIKYKDEL